MAIIALIYLPVSIASSIFGMNVQELNGQGVGIIWFVVAIFAAFGALLLCLLFFVLGTSQREAVKEDWRDWLHPDNSPHWKSRPWVLRLWFIGMTLDRVKAWPHGIAQTIVDFRDRVDGVNNDE